MTTEDVTTGEPAGRLARALADHLAARPRSRIELAELWAQAARADATLVGDPERRHRLLAAIQELADAGLVVLPKTPGLWDRRAEPALPSWVARPRRPSAPGPGRPARVWPHVLEAAAALATRDQEFADLARIADWLRDNPRPEPVPVEERSLEILGDEKRLADLWETRLFALGGLDPLLLACYETPLPFPGQHVPGEGPTRLLVLENNATYHSFLVTARALPRDDRPDLQLAWGGGGQFAKSVAAVALLEPAPVAVGYFGDLDLAGLRFAVLAAAQADALGLPPVRPAADLYRWLLAHGVQGSDQSNRGVGADHDAVLAWLPEDLRDPVGRLLRSRRRLAQEALGLRALRADPGLVRGACPAAPQ